MKNILFLLFTCVFTQLHAQQPTKPAAPVKMISRLGNVTGGNTGVDIVKRIADSTLNVTDTKGNKYPVLGFTVNYYFQSSYMDEETQQTKTVKDFRSLDFYDTNKLSEDWSASIKDNVKISDTLLINNIIIRKKDGRKTLAPQVKYVVMY